MKFSLVICTYKRARPLRTLLESVNNQSAYPNEILIIDGSPDDETHEMLKKNIFSNLRYIKVLPHERGLTKQRNIGIDSTNKEMELICFLDDDIVLTNDYFEKIIESYKYFPDALGVGGYIINNEAVWDKQPPQEKNGKKFFYFDGWKRKLAVRFWLRKVLGLLDETPPGFMPDYGHGKAMSFFPPSGNIYPTQFFLGGVSSFKTRVFEQIRFSEYFQGYGLYEDTDFTYRLSRLGKLYINTSAKLYHYHDESGRPNKFLYGKMVIRNGWYVWRVGFPNPKLKARIKWNMTSLLLTLIRFTNIFTTNKKKEALYETFGRIYGWFSIAFSKPGA